MMGFSRVMVKRWPDRVYLTPDSDSATPKAYGIHGQMTSGFKTFFLCGCVINPTQSDLFRSNRM